MIRVLIVDDSAFVRQALTRMLASDPEIEVVASATDGADGVAKIKELRPDVVTLDVKMPRVDGLEALRRIMAECPTPVLLLSSHTSEGADVTLRGLELGAVDFVDKTSVQGHMNLLGLSAELREKVRALAGVPRERVALQPRPWPDRKPARRRGKSAHIAEVVVIGTSTGGPPALQTIIPSLPPGLSSAVLIVQHMPLGQVLIAPAGRHMKVRKRGTSVRIVLDEEPRGSLHRPSIDVLMASVARVYGTRALGILLTGMGADGVEGLRAIRAAGGRTLAESEETCVIYGMPKAAVEAGVVQRSVPLGRVADEILAAV